MTPVEENKRGGRGRGNKRGGERGTDTERGRGGRGSKRGDRGGKQMMW